MGLSKEASIPKQEIYAEEQGVAPEHVRRMLRFSITKQWKMLLTAFREADVQKTGELTPQVLRDVLERFNIDMGDALFKHVIDACDEDKDGMVSVGEFMKNIKSAISEDAV